MFAKNTHVNFKYLQDAQPHNIIVRSVGIWEPSPTINLRNKKQGVYNLTLLADFVLFQDLYNIVYLPGCKTNRAP